MCVVCLCISMCVVNAGMSLCVRCGCVNVRVCVYVCEVCVFV